MAPVLICYESLTKEDIEWIASLPEMIEIEVPNTRDKIYVSHDIDRTKQIDERCKYKIYGHWHRQFHYTIQKNKYINPGSVGLPCTKEAGAEFSILEIDKNRSSIQNVHISYKLEEPIQAIRNSKIAQIESKWGNALIKLIQTGEDYPSMYLTEVKKLGIENGYGENLDQIPKPIWKQARQSLGIDIETLK